MRTAGASWRFGHAVRRRAITGAITVGLVTGVLGSAGLAPGVGVAAAKTTSHKGSSHKITVHKATGSAVTIGLISDAGGSGGARTGRLVEEGAQAATKYWNADLGGLEGHKVSLFVCEDQSTAAGGQSCATDDGQTRSGRRGRALHRRRTDRGADHRRCRHPLHRGDRRFDGRADHAGCLRARGRVPGVFRSDGDERRSSMATRTWRFWWTTRPHALQASRRSVGSSTRRRVSTSRSCR